MESKKLDNSNSIHSRFAMRWGGRAGDGLQSTGNLLQKYFNHLGFFVQGFPGTQSTIRGGHVWQHVEVASKSMLSHDRPLDLLIALNSQTLDVHLRDVKQDGLLMFDLDKVNISEHEAEIKDNNIHLLGVPFVSIARKVDLQTPVLANTVAVGSVLTLMGLPLDKYKTTLKKKFENNQSVIQMNLDALERGSNFFNENFDKKVRLEEPTLEEMNRFVISGNEMIAIGAVASGLKFLAQYPITPASSILTYLSNRSRKYGVVVRQSEDELAAINMIIGASYTGARAMTASSGPGLSLMAESFGYASMTETPIVLVNAMRGGPSTGIPTKMEQSDLNSMIYLSHGESQRAIFAPRNIREAFDVTVRAFNIADRFQLPVIILTDFSLSERTENVEPFDLDVDIDRGKIWKEPSEEYPQFKRYRNTEDGISPRAFPPTEDTNYILVGAEHDESSHSLSGNRCGLPSSWEIKEQMTEKRYRKLELLRDEMHGPALFGQEHADNTILCWGSIQGAVIEAAQELGELTQQTWNVLSFADLFPFPYHKLQPHLEHINRSIMIEVNYTGQFEQLIKHHLDWTPDYSIHPMTGETPTRSMLVESIMKEIGDF